MDLVGNELHTIAIRRLANQPTFNVAVRMAIFQMEPTSGCPRDDAKE